MRDGTEIEFMDALSSVFRRCGVTDYFHRDG